MRERAWYRNGRTWRRLLSGIISAAVLFYGLCYALTFYAAEIFNRVAEERDLFPGTVTTARIRADLFGNVEADGVRWTADDGTLLADAPSVRFHVKPWDVVTGRIGTSSITEVTLEKAYVHLFFDDAMRLRYIKPDGRARQAQGLEPIRLTGPDGNRLFDCRAVLRDGVIEAEAPGRQFRMEHVNLKVDADTDRQMRVDLLSGRFTGTIAADRMVMHGTVDFTGDGPACDLALSVTGCRPSALGAGIDIDDPVSVSARVKGPAARPVITGTLDIPELNVTALRFTELTGDFHYEAGLLSVEAVKGKVFGGTVEGTGRFDLDERSYGADIQGHRLRGGTAAKDSGLRCEVELDLHLRGERGRPPEAWGSFLSGPGQYRFLPFQKISGAFEREGGTVTIRDVVISLALGDVTTDAFTIQDGRVRLGPVYLMDSLSGTAERVY